MKHPILQILKRSKTVLMIISMVIMLASVVSCGTEPDKPTFVLTEFDLIPTEVVQGQTLTIHTAIGNTSDISGFYDEKIYIDGVLWNEASLSIEAKGTHSSDEPYTVPDDLEPGTHEVKFGEVAKHFTVNPSTTAGQVVITVMTMGSNQVLSTSAQLLGYAAVPSDSGPVGIGFEYGLDKDYGTFVNGTPATIYRNLNYTAKISNLEPRTTYHFRAIATRGSSIFYGDDREFQTPSQ
jgi:hypothetical protein